MSQPAVDPRAWVQPAAPTIARSSIIAARRHHALMHRCAAAALVLLRAGLGTLTLWAIVAATAPVVQQGPFSEWESRTVVGAVLAILMLLSLVAACAALLGDVLRVDSVAVATPVWGGEPPISAEPWLLDERRRGGPHGRAPIGEC